jgi:hypothetical protein
MFIFLKSRNQDINLDRFASIKHDARYGGQECTTLMLPSGVCERVFDPDDRRRIKDAASQLRAPMLPWTNTRMRNGK